MSKCVIEGHVIRIGASLNWCGDTWHTGVKSESILVTLEVIIPQTTFIDTRVFVSNGV